MHTLSRLIGSVVLLVALPFSASAQSIVVPGSFSSAEGGSAINLPFNSAARTVQYFISASLLNSLGSNTEITGLSFRLDAGVSASSFSTLSFSDYEIRIGEMVRNFGSISTTFGLNISDAVLVRDGALSFAASAYPSGGSPNFFGPEITFDTPYTYTPNSALVVEIRHTGSGVTGFLVDGTNSGWGNTGSSSAYGLFASSAGATSGSSTALLPIMSLTTVPEPATSAALAGLAVLGVVFAIRRRKTRSLT